MYSWQYTYFIVNFLWNGGDVLDIYIKQAISENIDEINNLLTDLIQDERKYDNNINKNYC